MKKHTTPRYVGNKYSIPLIVSRLRAHSTSETVHRYRCSRVEAGEGGGAKNDHPTIAGKPAVSRCSSALIGTAYQVCMLYNDVLNFTPMVKAASLHKNMLREPLRYAIMRLRSSLFPSRALLPYYVFVPTPNDMPPPNRRGGQKKTPSSASLRRRPRQQQLTPLLAGTV